MIIGQNCLKKATPDGRGAVVSSGGNVTADRYPRGRATDDVLWQPSNDERGIRGDALREVLAMVFAGSNVEHRGVHIRHHPGLGQRYGKVDPEGDCF